MSDIEILHIITAPTRYKIVLLLLERHYCVKAIAAKLGISEPAVSQQMQVLKSYGVVTGRKIDYQMHYILNHELVLRVSCAFSQSVSKYAAENTNPENCDCEYAAECNRRKAVK